jgi:hypothetical protein
MTYPYGFDEASTPCASCRRSYLSREHLKSTSWGWSCSLPPDRGCQALPRTVTAWEPGTQPGHGFLPGGAQPAQQR